MSKKYSVLKQPDGTFKIPDVEIFEMGNHRGTDYNQDWFDRWLANFNSDKQKGFLPGVIVGHTDPRSTTEKAVIAFADNPHIIGNYYAADYIVETDGGLDILKSGGFPHRSVEVDPEDHRIFNIASLGGSTPYHKLPPLKIQNFQLIETLPDSDKIQILTFDNAAEMTLAEVVEDQKKREALSDLDYALWEKMWAIREAEDMTPEQKSEAFKEAINEWAGLATTVIETKQSNFQLTDPQNLEKFLQTIPEDQRQFFQTKFSEIEKMKSELDKFKADSEKQNIENFMAQLKFQDKILSVPIQNKIRGIREAMADGQVQSKIVKFKSQTSKDPKDQKTKEESFSLDKAFENLVFALCSAASEQTLFAPKTETDKPFQPAEANYKLSESESPEGTVNFRLDQAVKTEMGKQGIPLKGNADKYSQIRQDILKKNPQLAES